MGTHVRIRIDDFLFSFLYLLLNLVIIKLDKYVFKYNLIKYVRSCIILNEKYQTICPYCLILTF